MGLLLLLLVYCFVVMMVFSFFPCWLLVVACSFSADYLKLIGESDGVNDIRIVVIAVR